MDAVPATSDEIAMWAEHDGCDIQTAVIGGPQEAPDVIPCPALIARDAGHVHVAFKPDEIELAALAQGGTLWLTTWGGLPIHQIRVTSKEDSRGNP